MTNVCIVIRCWDFGEIETDIRLGEGPRGEDMYMGLRGFTMKGKPRVSSNWRRMCLLEVKEGGIVDEGKTAL